MGPFEFLLFTTQTPLARRAIDAGIDALIIDWEFRGKERRQSGADTQINSDTPTDLARIKALPGAYAIVRINGFGPTTADEIESALDHGADELLLPMVQSPQQVERVLSLLRDRKPLGILIETTAALACARDLGTLPLRRVYVGLNDLAIARRTPGIFAPLVDGTLEQLRPLIQTSFGFGGLTLPDCGRPVPCRLLLAEMLRLGASHSFLRRSFLADIVGRDFAAEVAHMRAAVTAAAARPQSQVDIDHAELCRTLDPQPGAIAPLPANSPAPRRSPARAH